MNNHVRDQRMPNEPEKHMHVHFCVGLSVIVSVCGYTNVCMYV